MGRVGGAASGFPGHSILGVGKTCFGFLRLELGNNHGCLESGPHVVLYVPSFIRVSLKPGALAPTKSPAQELRTDVLGFRIYGITPKLNNKH